MNCEKHPHAYFRSPTLMYDLYFRGLGNTGMCAIFSIDCCCLILCVWVWVSMCKIIWKYHNYHNNIIWFIRLTVTITITVTVTVIVTVGASKISLLFLCILSVGIFCLFAWHFTKLLALVDEKENNNNNNVW